MGSLKWGCVLGIAPLAFALTLVVPEQARLQLGVGDARACSPIGPVDPNAPAPPTSWSWLRPSMMSLTGRASVPVGTDGFFVIDAEGVELSAEAAEAGMSVEVRDAAGELVPGDVWLLKEKQPGWYLFGWETGRALPIGAQLTARLQASPASTDPNVGGDFPLVVAGGPAELPVPTLSFSRWIGYFEGQGPTVSCAADPNASSCGGPDRLQVPGAFVQLTAAYATWQVPELRVGVAWEARLEASASDSDVQLADRSADYVVDYQVADAELQLARDLGLVIFPTAAKQHCVNLVTRDLRDGDESSVEVCEATQSPTGFEADSEELHACLAPPSDAAAVAWCRLQGSRAPESCEAILAAAEDDTPSEDPSGAAGAPSDGSSQPTRAPRTSRGCQLGAASTSSTGGWAAALLALLVGVRRRRR